MFNEAESTDMSWSIIHKELRQSVRQGDRGKHDDHATAMARTPDTATENDLITEDRCAITAQNHVLDEPQVFVSKSEANDERRSAEFGQVPPDVRHVLREEGQSPGVPSK